MVISNAKLDRRGCLEFQARMSGSRKSLALGVVRSAVPERDGTIYWLMSRACLELQSDETGIPDVRL